MKVKEGFHLHREAVTRTVRRSDHTVIHELIVGLTDGGSGSENVHCCEESEKLHPQMC